MMPGAGERQQSGPTDHHAADDVQRGLFHRSAETSLSGLGVRENKGAIASWAPAATGSRRHDYLERGSSPRVL